MIRILLIVTLVASSQSDLDCPFKCTKIKSCLPLKELVSAGAALPYCNGNNLVCCPENSKPKTIAEKKCNEYMRLTDVCTRIELIKGGMNVTNVIPFMASVQNVNKTHFCGGTVISDEYVLTAGHCFDQQNKSDVSVLLGTLDKSNKSDGIRINVTVIIHPKYGNDDPYADLALLKLDKKISFLDKIRPACLHFGNTLTFTNFTTAGWGSNDTAKLDINLLQSIHLGQKDWSVCQSTEDSNHPKRICTRALKYGTNTCVGDSGGPVFVEHPKSVNCWSQIIGAISEGPTCSTDLGIYTILTSVSYYLEWIEKLVWPNETLS